MGKIKNIWKMAYLSVILRTSGYGMFIGISLAVFVRGAELDIFNAVLGFIILIIMQGFGQHSIDTLLDPAPVENSPFRKFATRAFNKEGLWRIFGMAMVISAILVIFGIIVIGHWMIIPIYIIGVFFIIQYARTNIEWYPAFAFALCAVGGYLTQIDLYYTTNINDFMVYNMPICAVFFLLYGLFKIGQVLYRNDDYQREMTPKYMIKYYRYNLRYIHHQTQLTIIALIVSIAGVFEQNYWYSWVGFSLVVLYYTIWFMSRHDTCNNVSCINNGFVNYARHQYNKPKCKNCTKCGLCLNLASELAEQELDN